MANRKALVEAFYRFRVGDRVRVLDYCNGYKSVAQDERDEVIGKTGTVVSRVAFIEVRLDDDTVDPEGRNYLFSPPELEFAK